MRRTHVLIVTVVLVVWALPGQLDPVRMNTVAHLTTFALAVAGLNLIVGYTGQLSLGQTGFMAIGAYTSAIATTRWGWPPIAALLGGVVLNAVVALLLGLVVFRLRGLYFAIATLGFALAVQSAIEGASGFTGGSSGVTGVSPFGVGSLQFTTLDEQFYLAFTLLAIALLYTRQLLRSRDGLAMKAVAVNEGILSVFGGSPLALKLRVFVIASCLSSVAGSLYVHQLSLAVPDLFEIGFAIRLVLMSVLGGAGTLLGPVVGPCIELTREFYSDAQEWSGMIEGLIMAFVIAFMPRGVVGYVEDLYRRWRRAPAPASPISDSVRIPEMRQANGAGVLRPADDSLSEPTSSAHPDEVVLDVDRVRREFGGLTAVDDVSFTVRRGEILAIIGPNGAGKTTLLNLLTGMTPVTSGSVRYEGEDITAWTAGRRASLGMSRTFQLASLIDREPAVANVMVGRFRHRSDGAVAAALLPHHVARANKATKNRASQVLRSLGYGDVAHRLVGELPSGQARLVEVARAMCAQPAILFLDEPAGGLIDAERAELARQLVSLRDSGMTICLIEHNMDVVMDISDRIVVMSFGRVIADGPPELIRSDEAVVEAYLGRRTASAT